MNIELPKDEDGREIPLDTKALYGKDGEGLDVRHFEFSPFSGEWIISALKDGPSNCVAVYRCPQNVHLEKPAPPDSWDKLLEDLDNAARGGDNAECCYMRRECLDPMIQCEGCRLYNADSVFSDCSCLAYADIAARIRRLGGVSAND